MSKTKGFRTANRRYLYVFWPSMAAYVAIIFATSYFIDKETAPLWLKVAGALATTLPILGALWANPHESATLCWFAGWKHGRVKHVCLEVCASDCITKFCDLSWDLGD